MEAKLTFDESATEFVLESFGKAVDDDGYVIDAETGERVTTPDGEHIEADEFAGVEKGSTLYLDDGFTTIVDHVKRQKE